MNKRITIKIMQWSEMLSILSIVIVGFIICLTKADMYFIGVGVGLIIGVLVGGAIRIFIIVPKQFGKKDERTIYIEILSEQISIGFIFILTYLYLSLVAVEVVNINLIYYGIFVTFIVITKIFTLFVSRKIIENLY